MHKKYIQFSLEQNYAIKALAKFMAELEREGVTYEVFQDGVNVKVELTGGY